MRLRNIPGARDMIAASPWVIQKPEDQCGQWKSFFGNDHPLHLEIGTGKGRFIMQLAQEHPEINYIGIEKYSSVLLRCLEKQQKSISIFQIPGPRKDMQEGVFPPPSICAAMTGSLYRAESLNLRQITAGCLTLPWKKSSRAPLKSRRSHTIFTTILS